MMSSMEFDDYITIFIEMIKEKGVAKYGDHSKFSRAIYGPEPSSVVKWRTIRNGNSKGQRDIKLEDLLKISVALGEPLYSLIFQADELLKMLRANEKVTVTINKPQKKQAAIPQVERLALSYNAEAVEK